MTDETTAASPGARKDNRGCAISSTLIFWSVALSLELIPIMTLIYSFFRGTRWLVRVALCFLLFAPVALTIASSILKAYAVGAG